METLNKALKNLEELIINYDKANIPCEGLKEVLSQLYSHRDDLIFKEQTKDGTKRF